MTTIPALAAASAEQFGDRLAIVDADVRMTYAELLEESRGFGAALVASGVEPGDRVGIWAFNCAEWIIALFGIVQAGAILVPVNTRFKGVEAADILARTRVKVLVTVTDFLGTDYVAMLQAGAVELPDLRTIVVARGPAPRDTESWTAFCKRATSAGRDEITRRAAAVSTDDISDILFTSGTTGTPKGVVQTHGRTLLVAGDWVAMTGLTEGDRYLMVNPYFHMFGLKAGILAAVIAGATMYPEPVFDVDAVLAKVAADKITVLPGAPTVYQAILDCPDRDRHDLSSLRVAVTGAADIPIALIGRIVGELPFPSIVTGYGLTEAGTAAATGPADDLETVAATVGRPRPGFEIRIVDGTGADVVPGEPGEIILRGGSVMVGYLDDPESTAQALSRDGWLKTGDLGVVDVAGCLRIVGRSKDMFIVGGFNAYPAEIENALLRHPGVAEVAVIGVPDQRLGEVGKAFVVLQAANAITPEELIRWSRDEMANYKVPRSVEVVDELPRTATGKVMKDALRHRAGRRVIGLSAFADLRVVELGVWVAAPSTAALLADWGADVIKIEPPTGDPMRHVFGSLGIADDMPNPAFALDNRGKRSVVLNLREPAERQSLEELLATADVFISNLRPDALDGLGLEPAATVARHPHLVYCSVSGYGLRGEDRNRPTYDLGAFWARSGLSVQMADGDGNPLNARGGIGDHITGLAALAGVLGAVIEQRQTGHGRVVEVSLLRTGTFVLGWDLGLQLALGRVAGAEPRSKNQAPLMNPYRAADGRWFFITGLEAERHLPAVIRALDHPELVSDPRFASASAVRRNRVEVIALLDQIFAEQTFDEWAERFEREGVWWAPALTPAEVVEDAQFLDNGGLVDVHGGLRSVNGPVNFSGAEHPKDVRVPALGEHTDEVLKELSDRLR